MSSGTDFEEARAKINALLENNEQGTPEQIERDRLAEACCACEAKVDLGSEANGQSNVPKTFVAP